MVTDQAVSSPKEFTVTRSEPEVVGPAKPTPRELKPLSFIDNLEELRLLVPTVLVYPYNDSMLGVDPARVIREAVAQALVFYYPFAGHLREGPDGWLYVDCTGEGIAFVEADADVELAQLGDPPFSCLDELMCNVPSSLGIPDSHHLIYIQVTRMKCGGFIIGLHYHHAISDGGGISQFLNAVGEIARGAHSPSITPVWCRDIFDSPYPRRREKKVEPTTPFIFPTNPHRSLFFGPSSLFAIRMLVPDHLRPHCTTFEILTAYLWRCKVAASQLDPEHIVCLCIICSGRDNNNIHVPKGYYGNSIQTGSSETSARELCERPMEYAIGLVKKAKEDGFEKLTNLPALQTHPPYSLEKSYLMISDSRKLGTRATDFGWGEPAFAGRGKASEAGTYYLPHRNRKGEDGVLVMFCWPSQIAERVESEVSNILVQG